MRITHIAIFLISFFSLQAQDYSSSSPWHIQAKDFDAQNYYGITLANGMVGLVSSPEPMKIADVVLNGVYDEYERGRVSNILKTFSHMNLDLEINGQHTNRHSIDNFSQTLDMKTATLVTEFTFQNKASIHHELLSLRNLPYCALSIITVSANEDIEITAINNIISPNHLSDNRNYYSEIDRPHAQIPLLTSEAYSPGGKTLSASTSFIFPEESIKPARIIHQDWDYNKHSMKFKTQIKAGDTYTFAIIGSSLSSVHNNDPRNEVERLSIYANLEGIDRLKSAHIKAWEKLWESDIIIDGDLESQRDIRSALYHLYSFARKGSALSISPMGLSGLGYNGHVFWDTEIWMYPPLLLTQPDIARSLLEYRFNRLEAAKENAFAHGFDGAMFPWESAEDGSEETPVWALTGPFQQHITADIGWAFWKYYELSQDKEWLRTRGYPVLKEVAAFWMSRVERKSPNRYEINNVIGANEYQENINNNAFTNGMVTTVLEYCALAAEELGQEANPEWRQVAANIPILKFEDGTTRENETYDGEIIKQADVNLLAFPLSIIDDEESIRKDLNYYEPKLSPRGPAMGSAILSVIYSRLGEADKAFDLFKKSYKNNEVAPFSVLAETANGTNPYFATGAGGMLQAVLFGFGGLEINEKGIQQLNTKLPKGWKSIKMTGIGLEKETYTK
ncbi:glycoside hydrolase family 65 protein [Lentimicrobium sp. L6]|uniref:glycoside hydrolase family 65 protein n=1 Tax=Lentimicrobium sp. L6 TaxID=2735916 RepID=UPI00155259DB|nr:glycoside hydrolase family 65 protein [Lentimicrobium sp. L6]NPD86229.1 glycoside hydrolase family 65 protein [Lentimicrobium sp. L6]